MSERRGWLAWIFPEKRPVWATALLLGLVVVALVLIFTGHGDSGQPLLLPVFVCALIEEWAKRRRRRA